MGAPIIRAEVPDIEDIYDFLVDLWKRLTEGEPVRVLTTPRGLRETPPRQQVGEHVVDRDFRKIGTQSREAFIQLFFAGSDEILIDKGDLVQIFRPSTVPATRLIQRFRDGVEHCVFAPILLKLRASRDATKSKDVARRFKQRIDKIVGLSKKYKGGVPSEAMEEVAKACG
jgi:hypothetical protein